MKLLLLAFLFPTFYFADAQIPALGTYPAATIMAGGNLNIIPSAAPVNTNSVTAYTSVSFKGILQVNPVTGKLTITNPNPAGNYTITVKAFNDISTAVTTFNLTVTNGNCGNLGTPVNVPVGGSSYGVAVGDFNEDGYLDFLSANFVSNGAVSVRLGNGTGSFSNATSVIVGNRPRTVAVSDFNGDGHQDFAALNQFESSVSIRLGDGLGNFTASADIVTGTNPLDMTVADFDGDGIPDLAVANSGVNNVSIRFGNGIGGFNGATNIAVGGFPKSITTGDFNNDGKPDFATGNNSANTLSVRLNNGSGGFISTADIAIASPPLSIAAADFNNDGKTDLATVATVNNSGIAFIRLGNGTGNFSIAPDVMVGTSPQQIITADFNGDGKQDLATANLNSSVGIRLGDGTGLFIGGPTASLSGNPVALASGDFNSDGRPDLVVSKSGSTTTVSVFIAGNNEIAVFGNNMSIPDGNNAPAITNNTEFGTAGTAIRNYVIKNTGLVNLTISNIRFYGADSASFVAGNITLPATILPGDSAIFSIIFQPFTAGLKKAVVNIVNDDCDETIYDFAVQGTGLAPVSGTYPATVINAAGLNTTITPSSLPANVTQIFASASASFKGVLRVDSLTGVLYITNAHPAGTYTIAIRIFNNMIVEARTVVVTVKSPGCSAALFVSAANVTVASNPSDIAVADFNGDGKQDLAIANYGSNTVSINLGNGNGSFGTATNITVGNNPHSIIVGDYNGDGKQDFAAANATGSDAFVYFGDGAGGFRLANYIFAGSTPYQIAAGDFNGDGNQDFAAASNSSNYVSIRIGDGKGNFSGLSEVYVGSISNGLAIADFNNDGKEDLAIGSYQSNGLVLIRLGNGTGSFTGNTNVTVGANPESVATGDFNGDGNQDFATSNVVSNTVSIRLGNGMGGFTGTTDVPVGNSPRKVVVGDFNGDGKLDFIVSSLVGSVAYVRLGDGMGNFIAGQNISVGTSANGAVVGDFNGDGIQDAAFSIFNSNTSSSSISIRLGSTAEINVMGNGNMIPDGDATPDSIDNTLFGKINLGDSSSHTFTIYNTGNTNLTISSLTINGQDSAQFVLGNSVIPATIAAGSTLSFTIRFRPTTIGVKTATVNIISNDCDESIYDFAIRGTASCSSSSTNNVWLGTTADWNATSNWSLNFVPSECTKVVVNSGVPFMPEVTNPTSACYNLTLNNGATITVKTGGHLNITANN